MGCGKKDKVKPTAQETVLADISSQHLDRYKGTLAPFEDKWLAESRVSGGEKEHLAGTIAGDVEASFAPARKRLTGMNPAGGAFRAGMRDLAVGEAKAAGRAQAEGTVQAENADVSALMSGVRLGRGQAVEAQSGMGEMAGRATSRAINSAFADRAERDATADIVGSGLGVAAWGASKGMKPPAAKGMSVGIDDLNQNYSLTSPPTARMAPKYSSLMN